MTQRLSRVLSPAIVISTLVIGLCASYYAGVIPYGSLQHYDEFYTLTRTYSFLETGDWLAVQFNAQPDFKKPPLQYWLGALLIQNGTEPNLALRLWPLLFALALLAATGLLAYACVPEKPYTVPTAIILLSGSFLLWRHATAALLDTGSAFFLTLSVASLLLAVRDPRWWVVAGIAVGLGFLQKSPSALVVTLFLGSCLLIFERHFAFDLKKSIRTGYFLAGVLVALLLIAFWPVIQVVRFGKNYLAIAFYSEIVNRFSPITPQSTDSFSASFEWVAWMARDSTIIWIPALLSLGVLPFALKQRARFGVSMIALAVLLIAGILTIAGGRLYSRYLLQILPMLAVALAVGVVHLVKVQPLTPVVSLALVVLTGGPFFDMSFILNDRWSSHAAVARSFAGTVRGDETPIFCQWGDRPFLPPGALLHYAKPERPIVFLDNLEAFKYFETIGAIAPPYRGLCLESAFLDIRELLNVVPESEKAHDYVLWRTPAIR